MTKEEHIALQTNVLPKEMHSIASPANLDKVWRKTHRDYRGTIDGIRHILVLRNGGTCSVPLSHLTDAEIADRI